MSRIRKGRATVAVCAIMLLASTVMAGQLVSTMRNVSAVMSQNGYMIRPVPELSGQRFPGDVGFSQAFEIIRPNDEAITLGRLNTSCVCVTITADKKAYAKGERAIIMLHNVKATPPEGQMYAMYVQLSRPVRVTLRYDTFVRSGFDNAPDMIVAGPAIELPELATATAAAPAKKPEVQTSSTSNPLTVAGDNGIELIIPRWESEEDDKAEETAEKPADKAESGLTYSKQIVIEDAEPPAKTEEPASEPAEEKEEKDEPAGSESMNQGTYSKEIPAAEVTRPENVDQIIDRYAATYKADSADEDAEEK